MCVKRHTCLCTDRQSQMLFLKMLFLKSEAQPGCSQHWEGMRDAQGARDPMSLACIETR